MGYGRLTVVLVALLCALACASDESTMNGGQGMPDSGHHTGGNGGNGGMSSTIDAGGTSGGASFDAGKDAENEAAMPEPDAGSPSCAPREVSGTPEVHFHHVHFNTVDPEADLMFFEKFFNAPAVPFCDDASGTTVTRATHTERGWFLYTKVDEAPDPTLNTYLEHVGWVHPMPADELIRQVGLGITLYPEGRYQCPEAATGMMACAVGPIESYFYYTQAPSGARVEVALGPGPATSGFGHVHFIMGEDLMFFTTVSDGAFVDGAIDMVNHINASLTEDLLATEMVVDTRGKPIDHIAYSTTDLVAAKTRIEEAGIAIAEDISFKPEYGFRSFFVRTAKGTWLEMVEDKRFE